MKKILKLTFLLMLCIGLVGCGKDKDKTDDTTDKDKKTEYAVGETATVDGIKITVNSTRVDEGITPADDGKVYFVMDITLENTKDKDFSSSSLLNFELKDNDGRKQDISIMANLNGSMDTTIAPGEKTTGEIAFTTGAEGKLVLTYTPSFGDSVKITVR